MAARSAASAPNAATVDFQALYQAQWWPMVRLATGLVDDVASAEDVVQDAFSAMYRRVDQLRDHSAAVGYLRMAVVNAARSALRRRGAAARRQLRLVSVEEADPADHATMRSAEHELARTALRGLPDRQREVLTLRYLADLSDEEIARTLGIGEGGVRSAASRGLAALRSTLGGQL
jgi:RNA polymerase sigma-70 factor (sigma-E family)